LSALRPSRGEYNSAATPPTPQTAPNQRHAGRRDTTLRNRCFIIASSWHKNSSCG